MAKHSRRYNELLNLYDQNQDYSLEEAVEILKKMATAKFDETVAVHFRTGIDPRKPEEQIRTTIMLPHGTGKTVRVLVFAEGEDARVAQDAGADFIGDDETIAKIQNGWFDFDVAVATPQMMSKVGRLGRVLGPRGLMPSPKAGTVAPGDQLEGVINAVKGGRIEMRNDKTGNLHVQAGKASFSQEQLVENLQAVLDAVDEQKPSNMKGVYVKRVTLTTTMGPGIRLAY